MNIEISLTGDFLVLSDHTKRILSVDPKPAKMFFTIIIILSLIIQIYTEFEKKNATWPSEVAVLVIEYVVAPVSLLKAH